MCSLIFQKASWDSVTWWPQDPKYSSRAAPVYEGFLSLCLGHTGYCPIGQRKWHVPDSKNVGKHLTYWWEDLQYLYCNDVDVGVRRGWGPFLPSTQSHLEFAKCFHMHDSLLQPWETETMIPILHMSQLAQKTFQQYHSFPTPQQS